MYEEIEKYLDDIKKLTNSALKLILSPKLVRYDNIVQRLGDLIRENYRLLVLLKVSYLRLERIVKLVDSAGIS